MSDVTRVGKRIADFQYSPPYAAYSKVIIHKDNDTEYSSGTTTGRTLEFDCYFGSSTMASNVKTAINGYAYQPYSASDALLDPSAELGDAIYVNGYYSILASQETQYDPLCAANISAPDGGELASEYPYLSPIVRKVNQAYSDSAEALTTANSAMTAASNAQDDADTANGIITGWQYSGSTVKIDGSNLKANTVTATKLQGGTVNLLNGNSNTAGTLGITGASSADYKITISSNGAVAISAAAGSIALNTSSGAVELLSTGYFVVGADGIRPSANGLQMNGTSTYRWKEIWCTQSSLNSTSDRNDKTDISYDLSGYSELFDKIKPVTYKFIDGTSGRTHIGMIAQDIEESLGECGMTGTDFAAFLKDESEDNTLYGLRYSEFIGLMIAEIQALKARVAELENNNG